MRIHRELCPILQLLLDDLSRRFWHQPERIAGQVYERFAVFAEREMKSFPEMTQRILSIELTREFFVG